MVFSKDELIGALAHEVGIVRHLITTITADTADFRATPTQRSNIELVRSPVPAFDTRDVRVDRHAAIARELQRLFHESGNAGSVLACENRHGCMHRPAGGHADRALPGRTRRPGRAIGLAR